MAGESRWARLFRRLDAGSEEGAPPVDEAGEIQKQRDQLAAIVALVKRSSRRLPVSVLPQILELADTLDQVLAYADRQRAAGVSVDTKAIVTVSSAVKDYLPMTIEAFLAIPFEGDPEDAPAATLLRSQLDLLQSGVADVAEDIFAGDVKRLDIHGRFLEAKFREHDLTL